MVLTRFRIVTRRHLSLMVGGALAGVLLAEGLFRLLEKPLGFDPERIRALREYAWSGGETAEFEQRAHILYARRRGAPGVNSLGFLDDEHPREGRPGVLRIACLGSSTTEGGNDSGREGSYPYFLVEDLARRWGRSVEVLNFGISGWTSVETMVNYFLTVQDFKPDIILLHELVNDTEARVWPNFSRDYSHYRHSWSASGYSWPTRLLIQISDVASAMELRRTWSLGIQGVVTYDPHGNWVFPNGDFAPGTAEPFKRNIRSIAMHARSQGAQVVLMTMPYDHHLAEESSLKAFHRGLEEQNQIYRDLAQLDGFALIDLDAEERAHPMDLDGQFLDLVHLTAAGNHWKSERVARQLMPPGR